MSDKLTEMMFSHTFVVKEQAARIERADAERSDNMKEIKRLRQLLADVLDAANHGLSQGGCLDAGYRSAEYGDALIAVIDMIEEGDE